MAAEKGNKYALGNNGGRPPYYDDAEQLEKKVEEYFIYCEGEYEEREGLRTTSQGTGKNKITTSETYTYECCIREPETPSVTKFALYLGFASRSSLHDYIAKEEFSLPIKRGLLIIESGYEDGLWNDRPTGAIFALKNMGWADRQEIEHKGNTASIPLVLSDGRSYEDLKEELKPE